MDNTVDILRGWPAEGARERLEIIKAGVTLVNGDVVEMQADGTIDKVSATASNRVGLVISGNGDSPSAANTGKALVLWGNYIARVSNYTAGSWVPGASVTAKSGKFALGTLGTDPEVGYVVKVTAAAANETASVTIVVR